MFIITDENMSKIDWVQEKDWSQNPSNERDYVEFDPLEDIEVLAQQPTWCIVRTWRLFDTLKFMQNAWWKLWELQSDDETIAWVRMERNILTYYKPKWTT